MLALPSAGLILIGTLLVALDLGGAFVSLKRFRLPTGGIPELHRILHRLLASGRY